MPTDTGPLFATASFSLASSPTGNTTNPEHVVPTQDLSNLQVVF